MPTDLCQLSASELQPLLKSRQISPVELMRATLERAEGVQRDLNCFVTLCADEAMRGAREAQARLMSGAPCPLLTGLPFSVKDIVDTAGVRTTFGTLLLKDNVPRHDALAVRRLREAGAVLFAKTTTPEFGTAGLTESPLFGKTGNAWNARRTSGGSSGGAAVAVACGVGALAVATDGGGSTRIPAACNGVVGFKQSLGVVPHSQALERFANQTYVTPMTRTVADTALMLEVMAGEDRCDPTSIGLSRQDFIGAASSSGDLRGLRILCCLAPQGQPVAADVRDLFERALFTLRDLGADVEPFDPQGLDVLGIWQVINHTAWLARFKTMVERNPDTFSPVFLRQLADAKAYSAVDFQDAMIERTRLFDRVQSMMTPGTLLAMPTLTRTALPIDQDFLGAIEIDGVSLPSVRAYWYPFTMLFNMTGHPAVSVPCGFGTDGLPVGLHIVGGYRRDAELLRVASKFESAMGLLNQWPHRAQDSAPGYRPNKPEGSS